MKKFNEFINSVNEGLGSFSQKEHDIIGKDVIVVIHKTNNDGDADLYNQVGRVNDINENGSYLVRMLNGELYTFEKGQVMECPKVVMDGSVGSLNENKGVESKYWKQRNERMNALELEFDEVIRKYFGKISGNEIIEVFRKSYKKVYGE